MGTKPDIRIGLISDTHGLLRPEAIDALRGSDYIVHAGDIGRIQIIEQLSSIAPVTAIRGNIDEGDCAARFHETEVLQVAGVNIYVIHNVQELDLDPATAGLHVVVFGHSHRPEFNERNGVLFINPGSAGPRRFKLPVSVAELTICGVQIQPKLMTLLGERGV
jgi:putative phosphoesterase